MVSSCVLEKNTHHEERFDGFRIISKTKEELEAERDELLSEYGIEREELYHLNDIGDLSESEYLLYLKVKEMDFALETLY